MRIAPWITKLEVQGYRALLDVSLELQRLTVLIGPNGGGKSTFLDVFGLMAEALDGRLAEAVSDRGGLGRMLTLGRSNSLRIAATTSNFKVTLPSKSSRVHYEFSLTQSASAYRVETEKMVASPENNEPGIVLLDRVLNRGTAQIPFRSRPTRVMRIRSRDSELDLPRVTRNSNTFRRARSPLLSPKLFAPVNLDKRSPLRQPQTVAPGYLWPNPSGEDLFSVLLRIRSEHDEYYEQIEDALRAGFPGFKKLEFPAVGAGQVTLAWHAGAIAGPVFANELSAGTLRFLMLSTLLLSPEPPPIVLLDEPEDSLHPELLRLLAELMVQASDRMQVISCTHSEGLIRWLKPKDVAIVDRQDGFAVLRSGESLRLDRWMKEYTLDQLWRMNEIGGQP